jgi:hypothetical protein
MFMTVLFHINLLLFEFREYYEIDYTRSVINEKSFVRRAVRRALLGVHLDLPD